MVNRAAAGDGHAHAAAGGFFMGSDEAFANSSPWRIVGRVGGAKDAIGNGEATQLNGR